MSDFEKQLSDLKNRVSVLEEEIIQLKRTGNNQTSTPKVQVSRPQTLETKKGKLGNANKDWEKIIGQVWLPRIFLFVLIFGIIWGFKLATDEGFITESVRILIGYALVIGFFYIAKRQMSHDRKNLGIVLFGGAIVLSMITTFAAHVLYEFIPYYVAFLLNIASIAGGIFISKKYNNEPLANIMAIGGFFIPFLLVSSDPNAYYFVAFELALYISLIYYALKERFVSLYIASTFLFQLVMIIFVLISLDRSFDNTFFEIAAIAVVIQHGFILLMLLKKELYLKQQISTIFASFVLTLLWIQMSFGPKTMDVLLLIFIILYAGLTYWLWKKKETHSRVFLSIATFATLVLTLRLISDEGIALTLVAEGAIAMILGNYLKSSMQQWLGKGIYGIGLLMVLTQSIESIWSLETLTWTVALCTLYWFMKNEKTNEIKLYFISFHLLDYYCYSSVKLLGRWRLKQTIM